MLDLLEGSLLQVTSRPAGSFENSLEAEISDDGRWLAFMSFADLIGGGAGGASDIFLANFSARNAVAART